MQARNVNVLIMVGMLMFPVQTPYAEKERNKPPSRELLEFLGTYEDEKGKFLDPAELEKADIPEEKQNETKTEK